MWRMGGVVIRRGVVGATDVGLGDQSCKALEGEGVPTPVIKNELGGVCRGCPLGWMQGGGASGVVKKRSLGVVNRGHAHFR